MLLLPEVPGHPAVRPANQGAQEAAAELQNPTAFDYTAPPLRTAPANQIEQSPTPRPRDTTSS